jgi:hypothetical protein
MNRKKMFLIIVGIVIVITIAGWSLTGHFVKTGNYDNFAKCLAQKGTTMYGAEWCGNCKQQKEMFGESFNYVNYVECPDNQALCEQMGIQVYPTWIINGVHYPGTQSFETLSSLTGCNLK